MPRRERLCVECLESRLALSTFYLHQGDILQNAVDAAQPGDSILLDPGATFAGPILLSGKVNPDDQWICIETNSFPLAYGTRVSPSDAPLMATILAPDNLPAIQTQTGTSCYYLRGLEVCPASTTAPIDTLITLGDGSSAQFAPEQQARNIEIDQCYIHGWDGQTIKRGVALNNTGSVNENGISDSYLANFKSADQDSQAIAGWNGTGPYYIENNYLEAAGENVIFGGSVSSLQQVPANITILDNTFSKPLSWNPNDPSYAGIRWSVKNLLELKSARDVTIANNRFQNVWVASQSGDAIVLTPRGAQSGGSWVTVRDVTIVHNIITNAAHGILVLGSDDGSPSGVTTNLTIQDNLFDDVAARDPEWGNTNGPPHIILLSPGLAGGPSNIIIDHNTILHDAGYLLLLGGPVQGLVFTNNIGAQGDYGVMGNGLQGEAGLDALCPGYVFTQNVIVGGGSVTYPVGNAEPATWNDVGFVNYQADDSGTYVVTADSPYAGLGADITNVSAALF